MLHNVTKCYTLYTFKVFAGKAGESRQEMDLCKRSQLTAGIVEILVCDERVCSPLRKPPCRVVVPSQRCRNWRSGKVAWFVLRQSHELERIGGVGKWSRSAEATRFSGIQHDLEEVDGGFAVAVDNGDAAEDGVIVFDAEEFHHVAFGGELDEPEGLDPAEDVVLDEDGAEGGFAGEDFFFGGGGHEAEIHADDAALDDFFVVAGGEGDLAAVVFAVEFVVVDLDLDGLTVMVLEHFGHVFAVGEHAALGGGDVDGLDSHAIGLEFGVGDEGFAQFAKSVGGGGEVGEFMSDGCEHKGNLVVRSESAFQLQIGTLG
jgi:hypothetical protein